MLKKTDLKFSNSNEDITVVTNKSPNSLFLVKQTLLSLI